MRGGVRGVYLSGAPQAEVGALGVVGPRPAHVHVGPVERLQHAHKVGAVHLENTNTHKHTQTHTNTHKHTQTTTNKHKGTRSITAFMHMSDQTYLHILYFQRVPEMMIISVNTLTLHQPSFTSRLFPASLQCSTCSGLAGQ